MQPGNNEDAQRQRITAFTLALLEDSGWYVPKDNLAQMLEWGAQEGCEFVYKHCRQFMKQAPRQQYFCKEQKSQTTGKYRVWLNRRALQACVCVYLIPKC